MPAPTRSLTLDAVHEFVHERIFTPGSAGNVGIELEWFPPPRTSPARLRELLPDPLPGGSAVTFEPGGQLELSGPPGRRHRRRVHAHARRHRRRARRVARVRHRARGHRPRSARRAPACRRCPALPGDGDLLRHPLAARTHDDAQHGIGAGERRHREPPPKPSTPAGSARTISGPRSRRRSQTLRSTHWVDRRVGDRRASRSGPRSIRHAPPPRTDAAPRRRTSYATYALDAPVMMINESPTQSVAMRDTVAFSTWLADGHELGWPTIDDFAYHLTTLFPPVRPRGWLELRMIDALQEEWWPVAVAVTAALLDDPAASDAAAEAVAPVRDSWTAAARDSLAVPALHVAAERCFAAALDAFGRLDVDAETVRATDRVPRPLRRPRPVPGRRPPRQPGGPRLHRRLTVVTKPEIVDALEDGAPPHARAPRSRPGGRPGSPGVAADVAPLLGPRAHRALRGALADPRAHRRRAHRRALRRHLRRVQAPAP